MRAEVKAIESYFFSTQHLQQPVMNPRQLRFINISPSNRGLIGDDNQSEAHAAEIAERVAGPGDQRNLFRIGKVRHLFDDRAVPIEYYKPPFHVR